MRCPNISELPPPPPEKTGWPWTVESPQLPDKMPDGSKWPRISVVTPSYNQGVFIEETIRSVLLQGYPNLEYYVLDGASADQSVEIIRRYDQHIAFWRSHPDQGQSDAINEGLARGTGNVLCWLNSDDVFEPGALVRVAEAFQQGANWMTAGALQIDETSAPTGTYIVDDGIEFTAWVDRLSGGSTFSVPQPSTFWTRDSWQLVGPLDGRLTYVFDHIFFVRLCRLYGPPVVLPHNLSRFRRHSASKTVASGMRFRVEGARASLSFLCDPLVNRRMLRRNVRKTVISAEVGGQSSIRDLLRYPFSNPWVLGSRFYLGALRRHLFRTSK